MQDYCDPLNSASWEGNFPFEEAFFMELKKEQENTKQKTTVVRPF